MPDNKNEVSLCFSGGLDSTTTALLLAERFSGKIHLLTMLHGHGQLFSRLSLRPLQALQRILGEEKIEHHFISTREVFKKIVLPDFFRDASRYGWQIACCLGCHLGFAAGLTIYNLRKGIKHMAIASCPHDVEECFNAQPPVVRGLTELYARHGIVYSQPLIDLNMDKKQARHFLNSHGIRLHFRIRHRTMGTQPICLLGLLLTWPDIFIDWKPHYDHEKMREYIRIKKTLVDEYINDNL